MVVGAVALLTLLFGFGLSRDPRALRSPLVEQLAPEFALRTLEGGQVVRLSDLRGQVVVINFLASWCVECRIEHPALAAAWRRYRDRGVVLLGIPFQDPPAETRRFAAELRMGWPILADPESETALAYGVYGVPETVVVGREGRVAAKFIGPVSYEALSRQITALLREARR